MTTDQSVQQFFAAVARDDIANVRGLLDAHPDLATAHGNAGNWTEGQGTALQLAAEFGYVELMQLLLDRGAPINDKATLTGWSPLHLAVKNAPAANLLLSRGAEVDLHAAAGLGDLERVRQLTAGHPERVNEPGPDGATPLHFARTPEVAAWLLDLGAHIEARDTDHHLTPLGWNADNPAVAGLLVQRGAAVDTVFLAAAIGDLERVRRFVQSDPGLVNARTPEGDYYGARATPLHIAAANGHHTVVTYLLEHGADGNAIGGWFDVTPLHWAAKSNATEVARTLLAHNANASIKDGKGHGTPLDWARHFGQQAMITLLSARQ